MLTTPNKSLIVATYCMLGKPTQPDELEKINKKFLFWDVSYPFNFKPK